MSITDGPDARGDDRAGSWGEPWGAGTFYAGVMPLDDPGNVRPIATEAERRALSSVLRIRILRMCRYEELTNRQIADRLGRNPATVLHHVRTLVDTGFLVVGDPRRGARGSRELPYRATGRSWALDFGHQPGTPPERHNVMLRAFMDEVAGVPESAVECTRLGLQLSPERLVELRERLQQTFDEFAADEMVSDQPRISMFLAVHPEVN